MSKMSKKVAAAVKKALDGLEQRPRFTFAEVVEKFRAAGLVFELQPAAFGYTPLPPNAQDMVFEKGATVHHFDYVEVMREVIGERGENGIYLPVLGATHVSIQAGWTGTSFGSRMEAGSELGKDLEAIMLQAVPDQPLRLVEDIVDLPVPEWAVDETGEPPISMLMFRSEAEQAWKEFVSKKPMED